MGMIVSRRGLLEGTLVIAASASTCTARAEADLSEAQKIAHADAKYQPTPNGQQRLRDRAARSLQDRAQPDLGHRLVPVLRRARECALDSNGRCSDQRRMFGSERGHSIGDRTAIAEEVLRSSSVLLNGFGALP
jgi:hypothetical protein